MRPLAVVLCSTGLGFLGFFGDLDGLRVVDVLPRFDCGEIVCLLGNFKRLDYGGALGVQT